MDPSPPISSKRQPVWFAFQGWKARKWAPRASIIAPSDWTALALDRWTASRVGRPESLRLSALAAGSERGS